MLTQIEKTIPLLTSNEDDQIINAIQLLDTMHDLYPSEVEQVWSLLNKEEIIHIWSVYFARNFPRLQVEQNENKSLNTWFTLTWAEDLRKQLGVNSIPSTFFGITIDVHGRRKYRGHKLYVSLASFWRNSMTKVATVTYVHRKGRDIEEIELASVDRDSPEEQSLLGVKMSNASLNSFHDVLTLLNSPLLRQSINEYLEIIDNAVQ